MNGPRLASFVLALSALLVSACDPAAEPSAESSAESSAEPSGSDGATGSSGSDSCTPGTHRCACDVTEECVGALRCIDGVCINPPQTSDDDDAADGATTSGMSTTASADGDGTTHGSEPTGSTDGGSDTSMPTGPVQGTCSADAWCAYDSDLDGLGDHCVFQCDDASDCPHQDQYQCYTCEPTVVGNVCVPDQNGDGECNGLFSQSGGLVEGAICLFGECDAGLECLFFEDIGVATRGSCAPACTP